MRTLVWLFVFTPLLLAWQSQIGQNQTGTIGPDGHTPGGTDCAMDGYAVNAITGEPVPRVRVSVGSPGPAPVFVTADSSGHWRFTALACGPVQVMVSRQGFLNGSYVNESRGPVVSLSSGSPVHDIAIRLTPASVITGKVVDDQGDPVVNAPVIILTSRITDGRRGFVLTGAQSGNSETNDLGEFRLAGLSAGKYIVCVEPIVRPGVDPRMSGDVIAGEACYPGSFETPDASALDLAVGSEMRIDITAHGVTPVHVRGVITGMPKTQGVALTLNRRRVGLPFGARPAKVTPDGKFDVAGVGPGSYVLSTDYFEAGTRLHARVPVEVGSADVNDVTVHLDSGFTIAGKVRIDSKSSGSPVQKVVVALRSVEPMNGGGATQWNADHSAFTISDLTPGNYRLEVTGGGKSFVKSATLAGHEILGLDFPLQPPAGLLDIVLSDDGGALDVQVTTADSHPAPGSGVMVLRDGGRPRTAVAGPDGHAVLQGLSPGEYEVYAWDDIRQAEYADPDWMQRHGAGKAVVTVQAGQFPQVAVKQQLVR